MSSDRLRSLALGLLLCVVTLGALTVRAVVEGERALSASDEAFNRGAVREAAQHARRAAVLYAPGAPHVTAAYARLQAIAVGSEAASDRPMARLAWRAIRGAVLETRHLWVPFPALLEQANHQLARLDSLVVSSAADAQAERRHSLDLLSRLEGPRTPWVLLLGGGLLLSILGLVRLAWSREAGRDGGQLWRWSLGAALTLLGLVCWTLAAYQA